MASRAFSSPRSLQMLLPILLVSIGILVIALVRQQQELSERPAASTMVVPSGWSTYFNPSLKLSVAIPSDADVAAGVESTSNVDRNGRVGSISVNSNTNEKPHWSVLVYTTAEKAEKDFGTGTASFPEYMNASGLSSRSTMIDGTNATEYYGVHPVDGVGGSEYDYVAAEVVGSTYTYMIQFYNMGTNPDAAAIAQYLSGFDAE